MMDLETRLRLGKPLNLLTGYCKGADVLPEDCKPWAEHLMKYAAELEAVWDEFTRPTDEKPHD